MYKIVKFIPLLALSAFLISCEFSSDTNSDNPAAFEYPLEIGNAWEYERVFETFNFRPDTLKERYPDIKITSHSIVEVKRDTTLQDSLSCSVVQETFNEESQLSYYWGYYANRADGFYQYAYKNGGGRLTMPKRSTNVEYTVGGISFKNMRDASDYFTKFLPSYASLNDTLIYWEPERKVLTYPPEPGEEWLMFEGPPFTIHKKILGMESVSTDAGNYDCYKIQWVYTGLPNENISFFDYICEKGLIKRSILFEDVVVSNPEFPDGIGYMDSSDEIILTDINF